MKTSYNPDESLIIQSTVEPHYNEVLGTMKLTLWLISYGFSLYQGKKHKEI